MPLPNQRIRKSAHMVLCPLPPRNQGIRNAVQKKAKELGNAILQMDVLCTAGDSNKVGNLGMCF